MTEGKRDSEPCLPAGRQVGMTGWTSPVFRESARTSQNDTTQKYKELIGTL